MLFADNKSTSGICLFENGKQITIASVLAVIESERETPKIVAIGNIETTSSTAKHKITLFRSQLLISTHVIISTIAHTQFCIDKMSFQMPSTGVLALELPDEW